MAEPRHWYLVMYDVGGDKRLRAVHKKLKAWGNPVQYSVFRVRAAPREMEQLRHEVLELLEPDDRLMTVRLCDGCAGRVTTRGRQLVDLEADDAPFILR
jgi:CRISPR-associated protein Cas2